MNRRPTGALTLTNASQAIAMKLVKKAAKMDVASKFRSMQANARSIKHYRSKLQKCIIESIQGKFSEAYERANENPVAFLDKSVWIYQDLIRIEEEVAPCFPPSYEIYNLYVREYHRALNALLNKVMQTDPEASVLLTLHGWIKEYKKNMKELGVAPELMEPPLLDGNEQNLIEDYLKLIIKKLDEWSSNLMKTEIEALTVRAEPPEVDSDGLYGMQGAVILFQMVNQQVDSAMDSGQGIILMRVVEEVSRVMRGIQEQWTRLVDAEYKKHAEKPEEVAGGLVEYCIALANDQLKAADFAETLSGRVEPLVSEKYSVIIHERLNDAIDGYLDVAKKCTQTLIDMIFNDLRPATKQLFQPPWYDGIMSQIIETMNDYMSDYQSFLNQSLFDLLVEDLLDSFLVTYITALANAPKLKMPAASERIKEDINGAYKFFGTYKKTKELEPRFEVLEMILSLLEASKSLVFLSYWSFAKVHGPNIAFVENLMKARGDFDRSAVSEVMESIKRKAKEEELTDRTCLRNSSGRTCIDQSHSRRAHNHEENRHPGCTLALPCPNIALLSTTLRLAHCVSCSQSRHSPTRRCVTYMYHTICILHCTQIPHTTHRPRTIGIYTSTIHPLCYLSLRLAPVRKRRGDGIDLLELPREPG